MIDIPTIATLTPGMSNAKNLSDLHALALSLRDIPGDIVEIGVWCGRSTLVLAVAARQLGCRVIAVDSFPPYQWWVGRPGVSLDFLNHHIAPVYDNGGPRHHLEIALERAGLRDVVDIREGSSRQLFGNCQARLCFVDGDHDYEAVLWDARVCKEVLSPGGVVVFDDFFHFCYPGVREAAYGEFSPVAVDMWPLNLKMCAFRLPT